MGLTVTISKVYVIGDRKEVIFDVTGDNNYLNAGSGNHGEALTGATLGLDIEVNYVAPVILRKSDGTTAFVGHYDHANSRLQVFKSNGTTDLIPVASGVDLSGHTGRGRAVGKGKASA